MADFNAEPSQVISLDAARRLISGSKVPAPVRAARKIQWRRLARLPAQKPGWSFAIFFIASLVVPHESIFSTLLLATSAVFAAMVFDRWKRKLGRRG